MRMYMDIDDNGYSRCEIQDLGCGAAVATSSIATELVKRKDRTRSPAVTNKAVVEALDGSTTLKDALLFAC